MESGKQHEYEGRVSGRFELKAPKPVKPWAWILWFMGTCLLCCFPVWLDPVKHRFQLEQMVGSWKVEHPSNSKHVRFLAEYGILTGASDHCYYIVGEVRQTSMSLDDLKKFYENGGGNQEGSDRIIVELATDFVAWDFPRELRMTEAETRLAEEDGEVLYVVYRWDDNEPGWDLACLFGMIGSARE